MSQKRNQILFIIPIGIMVFIILLIVPLTYEDKQKILPLSKESCESFEGFWNEYKLECQDITLEECNRMGGIFELSKDSEILLEEPYEICR